MNLREATSLVCRKHPTGLVYVGIDPGACGAIAFLAGNDCYVCDIPTIKVDRKGGTKTEFDNGAIVDGFKPITQAVEVMSETFRVGLEIAPPGIPGKGNNAYTGFRLGWAVGMWPLFLASYEFPTEFVSPSVWKRAMGLWGRDKSASLQKARQLFPKADLTLKKHEGRAEAALMALWLRRKNEGGK